MDEKRFRFEKDISGCSLTGFMSRDGRRMAGGDIITSICNLDERCNGLGAGYAAYGIYPDFADHYAFHMLLTNHRAKEETERLLHENFKITAEEPMPTKKTRGITDPPILWRYFVRADEGRLKESELEEDDFVVEAVMKINASVDGAFVMSSGKNMGAFKAVGFPGDVGEFYRLEDYQGWTWIAHGRFPTNTPGWWGGAHPFTLLDWSIVHNGEISSYGINKRYLEMFGYCCTLMTDTEATAYLFDLLLRRHKLPIEVAALALASPFWVQIDHLPNSTKEVLTAIRQVYGAALLNGPFAFILGHKGGMIGLNDRIKLRPLVAAEKADVLYIASEEAAIREICAAPDRVWMPKAGEPVIGRLKVKEYA